VITGASSGIGAATAVEAGRAGMHVVLSARRRRKLKQVARAVRDAGGEARVAPADVADEAQIEAVMRYTRAKFGDPDALFANAGFGWFHAMDRELPAVERRLWEVNYFGALRTVRAAARIMKKNGGGHILICSSLVSRCGLPYYGTYAATKAALHATAAAMQLELEGDGINLSCVYPGATATEFHERIRERCGHDPADDMTPNFMNQSARQVARSVIRCLRRPRPEVWPRGLDHAMAALWTAFPRLRTFCLRRLARRARQVLPDAAEPEPKPARTAGPVVTV